MATAAAAPRFPSGWRSLTEHSLDPADLHAAAQLLGERLADGKIDDDAAYEVTRALAADAKGVSPSGLQARLCGTLGNAADYHDRRRNAARIAAAKAGRNLIERKMPPADIITAARLAANGIVPGILSDDEIREALRGEWERIFGRFRPR